MPGTLRIDELPDGAWRVRAREWPLAAWCALPTALVGVPLLVWSAADGHPVEGGGAVVLCAVAAVLAWLGLARRSDLVLRRDGAVAVRGRGGAWPFARPVVTELRGPVSLDVVAFAVPHGAPELPDRGGDLVLRSQDTELVLARRSGPRWREELSEARSRLARLTAPETAAAPPR